MKTGYARVSTKDQKLDWQTLEYAEHRFMAAGTHDAAGLLGEANGHDCPDDVFRYALLEAWTMNHFGVRRYAQDISKDKYEPGERRELLKLFRRARFDVSHLPDRVRVWRGGMCWEEENLSKFQAPFTLGAGASWTLGRDLACWFAMRSRHSDALLKKYSGARPCVVSIELDRRHVLAHFTNRDEDEIITLPRNLRIARRIEVDGGGDKYGAYQPSDDQLSSWIVASNRTLASCPACC